MLFIFVWSLELDASLEAQAGQSYSITERMHCLYTVVMVCLLCLNVVLVSDLRALRPDEVLLLMFAICCLKDITECLSKDLDSFVSGVLFMMRWSMNRCSAILLNIVTVDLAGWRVSLFVESQSHIVLRYGWI